MNDHKNSEDLRVKTGSYFESGNFAIAEGAIAAGLTHFYGYPITPATEVMELIAKRLPDVNGAAYQMEDEIASIISCIGSSWAGGKTMTSTSGPGFSLMQEGIGLAFFTETPLVIVNSMRMGPSTGNPTLPSQGDFMQTKFGSHGDYLNVVLAPSTVQECFDMTITAFKVSELLRVPVILLVDQILSSLHEDFTIPSENEISVVYRALPQENSLPLVNPMPIFGQGFKGFNTGLSHGDDGTPDLRMEIHEKQLERMMKKLTKNPQLLPPLSICTTDDVPLKECDAVFVSYGSSVRSIQGAIRKSNRENLKIGCIALKTVWPFPEKQLNELVKGLDSIISVEMSFGQLIWPLKRYLDDIKIESINYVKGKPIPPSLLLNYAKKRKGEVS